MLKRIIVGFILLFSYSLNAQISVKVGGSYNTINDAGILDNKEPMFSSLFGASIRLHPFKETSKFSIESGLLIQRKGYIQELDNEKYNLTLNYMTIPAVLNYKPNTRFSVFGGIAFNHLVNTSRKRGNDTYTQNDVALNLGVNLLEHKKLNIFIRGAYGLIPIIDYYKIDKLGNFTNKIDKFNTVSFSLGLKINIYDEKIKL